MMLHCPSLAEHAGPYNIPKRDCEYEDVIDSEPCFSTSEAVPPLTGTEVADVRRRLYETLVVNSVDVGMAVPNARALHRGSVQQDPTDRTMQVLFPEFHYQHFRAELVAAVQREVLLRSPLWRVLVVGNALGFDSNVIIYPEAVRIGSTPLTADWNDAFLRLISSELARRASVEQFERRQWANIRVNLEENIRQAKSNGENGRVIGVFDNWNGEFRYCVVWFFFWVNWDEFPNADDVCLSVERPSVATGVDYPVTEFGEFGNEYEVECPSMWVTSCIVDASDVSEIEVQYEVDCVPIGPARTTRISPNSIICDADLLNSE